MSFSRVALAVGLLAACAQAQVFKQVTDLKLNDKLSNAVDGVTTTVFNIDTKCDIEICDLDLMIE